MVSFRSNPKHKCLTSTTLTIIETPLTKTELSVMMKNKYFNSNHAFHTDVLKFDNHLSSFNIFCAELCADVTF